MEAAMAAFDARRGTESAEAGDAPSAPAINRRRLVGKASTRREKMIAFGYYGGKFSHLDFILPLLPTHYQHYCEPFGGSAAVLINRPPAPVETYNDLDSEVANFFRVLRDDSDALIRRIALTPFSREELVLANAREAIDDPVERARRFFVRARQTRTGLAQTSTEGRWAHCVLTSRAGMAGAVSRWLGSVEGLAQIVQRLQRVQIESAPAVEVVRRYDSRDTLFYCDPPYPHESRGDSKAYGFELSDAAHEELADALHEARGAVAVSGYSCPLMNRLYGDWIRVDAPPHLCNSSKSERVESVWLNFPVPAAALATAGERQLVLQVQQPVARYGAKKKHGRGKA
ncbi:MAG: DNA adenine methylase [Burkholderiales bacterium]|nr:DNA adenine methylase [Burkholderiales bacterium]